MNNCIETIGSKISSFYWLGPTAKKQYSHDIEIIINETKYNKLVFKKKVPKTCKISAIIGEYGIYAKTKIKPGQIVGYYLGTVWSKSEFNSLSDRHHNLYDDYAISCFEWIIDATDLNMKLRYINDGLHGDNEGENYYNVKFEECYFQKCPVVRVKAIKLIQRNEQLFVDYGKNYWITRGIISK